MEVLEGSLIPSVPGHHFWMILSHFTCRPEEQTSFDRIVMADKLKDLQGSSWCLPPPVLSEDIRRNKANCPFSARLRSLSPSKGFALWAQATKMSFKQPSSSNGLEERVDAVAGEIAIGVWPGHWCWLFSSRFCKLSEKKRFNILQWEWNFPGAICYQCSSIEIHQQGICPKAFSKYKNFQKLLVTKTVKEAN